MIILLSPAKNLDFESEIPHSTHSLPQFMEESEKLMGKLKKLSSRQIGKLMSISPALAELNRDRYASWQPDFTPHNARQAVFAFNGEVYRGLDAKTFTQKNIDFAQEHLRILSGLHGILRPLDLIQPYRLEMGSRLQVTKAKNNLYKFWGNTVTRAINKALEGQKNKLVVNLASNEYFKVVQPKDIEGKVISPQFMDLKNGEYKSLMTYAKLSRGRMASWLIREKITEEAEMKDFHAEGYAFNERLSKGDEWVFTRD